MNLDTKLKCKNCGKERDLFLFLVELGFSRQKLVANFISFAPEVKQLLPRLKCDDCGSKHSIFPKLKQERKTQLINKKIIPYSQKLVASDRAVTRMFHKQKCGYAKKIKREDEVFFDSREDAIQRFYSPCPKCRP